ncbi:acyloxyacyl hydrolase [Chthonobacter rhizosphaerae]|uniref:acyloxyacyl hydrolase n=1 Tax=Chthonobacter rhizosphaerae TaxID=2735553 RepID=UPI0015EF0FC9|nr:acyloxyacyl hydrolase [Chthonobacter rhizosphaerae]
MLFNLGRRSGGLSSVLLTGAVLLALAGPAFAADLDPSHAAATPLAEAAPAEAFRLFDEVRARMLGTAVFEDDTGVGVGAEILSSGLPIDSGNSLVDFVFGPRLHAGVVAPVDSDPAYGYAGFTWTIPVTDALFLEASLGGALNTGGDNGPLGCVATFREAAAVGWSLDEHWRILAGIEHLSHADLCGDDNPGMTSVSASVGYRF